MLHDGAALTLDRNAGCGYIRLSSAPVAATKEFASGDVLVDLDRFGVVRGIELLDPDLPVDWSDFKKRFHLANGDEALVDALLESALQVGRHSQGSEGTTFLASSSLSRGEAIYA